ncbi:MAG: ABC transporter ATP-binding protein [Gammaproteobacteria bacterium]|nr:ABC transporter ATP-binding protein [Gammaproteobacteria bacterium]
MIRTHNLHKRLGRRDVLQGLDLEIERGQRVALIGSNGAGKTTLIRCLLGEYTRQGEVTLVGRDPRRFRTEVLRHVGFVPQLPPPLKMPVGQLIRYVASLCAADTRHMIDVAARLGFDAERFRHHPFVRLSGGQKQKLLIATALGRNADILILDEPAANLDPEARSTFFSLLAEREKEAVMLISSHRLDEVAALVNRVVELDQGKVVLDDRVADSVDLTSRLDCHIALTRPEPAFAKAITPWGFSARDDGTAWHGTVAGADRLRFLGMLSRYVALIGALELREIDDRRRSVQDRAHA